MYALFFDDDFNETDRVELGEVINHNRDMIEFDGGKLNKISSPFIICQETEIDSITLEDVLSFYAGLVIDELRKENDERIDEGFYSLTLDAHFPYAEKNRNAMNNELTLLSMGLSSDVIEFNSIDQGIIQMDHEQFKELCKEAGQHERTLTNEYWDLVERVKSCESLTNLKEINGIESAKEKLN